MQTHSQQTLAQIVSKNHKAAAVFEKYNLDFCCKGRRSLADACIEKSLILDEVLTELENTKETGDSCNVLPDFNKLPISIVAEYILNTHHDYVKKELPRINSYLLKVSTAHSNRHPELTRIFEAFAAIKEEMELHMQKEETVLFPRLKELDSIKTGQGAIKLNISYLISPISILDQEHEHVGSLMQEIRELTHSYVPPADACATYKVCYAALQAFEKDLHQHVHLVNNILFPRAIELFRQLQVSLN